MIFPLCCRERSGRGQSVVFLSLDGLLLNVAFFKGVGVSVTLYDRCQIVSLVTLDELGLLCRFRIKNVVVTVAGRHHVM